jgi:hypoxanthine phosphoribosyltransferase
MEVYLPEIYIPEEEIQKRVSELATTITRDYANDDIVVLCVLKGAFMFCADLLKKIQLPVRLEFISLSSYGESTISAGEVKVIMDVTGSIEGKNVLVVEDIVDTGLTIKMLMNMLKLRNPKTLKLAALLHKAEKTVHPIHIDYLAFEIADKFVIGYGLDYAGRYRELPYLGILNVGN